MVGRLELEIEIELPASDHIDAPPLDLSVGSNHSNVVATSRQPGSLRITVEIIRDPQELAIYIDL